MTENLEWELTMCLICEKHHDLPKPKGAVPITFVTNRISNRLRSFEEKRELSREYHKLYYLKHRNRLRRYQVDYKRRLST